MRRICWRKRWLGRRREGVSRCIGFELGGLNIPESSGSGGVGKV